jgi:uncharacterized membrane protein YvbJ
MYCSNCGRKNDEGVKFCAACGSPLDQGRIAQSAIEKLALAADNSSNGQ